jgi:hypothetical protein
MVISRRSLSLAAITLLGASSIKTLSNAQTQDLHVKWEVPQDALATANSVAHFNGAVLPAPSDVQERSPALLFILVGSVAIPYLVDALIEIYRGQKGGAYVDTTVEPVIIRHDPALPAGIIILKTKDQTSVVDTKKLDAPTNLLRAIAH